jgi:replicative DNA helicase
MLSEKVINTCFDVCVATPTDYPKCRELFSAIFSIFNHYIKNTPVEERPLNSRIKIEFVHYIARFRFKTPEQFSIERIKEMTAKGKYSDLSCLLQVNPTYTSSEIIDEFLTKTIIPKRKGSHLGSNIIDLKQAIEHYENDSFEDLNDLLDTFENIISRTHVGLKELNRIESISKSSCLDLLNDDYNNVLERFRMQCTNNIIKSGFDIIDETLPFGGFESGRVYIFGGETGVGKSVMLLNILANTVKMYAEYIKDCIDEDEIKALKSKKKQVHLYITAENLIDESLIRYYCASTGRSHNEVVFDIKNVPNFNPKKEITEDLVRTNSNILFYYVPARLVKLSEIEAIIDETIQKYELKSVYIDYLDLIRSGTETELRHELGEVTSGFKRFAILNNVPVITATQLNRSGYNNSKASFTSMSESMEKANDTDFLAYLQRTDKDETRFMNEFGAIITGTKVRLSILKNRGGPTGKSTELLLEKTLNGKNIFNYQFKEVPDYKEIDAETDHIALADYGMDV